MRLIYQLGGGMSTPDFGAGGISGWRGPEPKMAVESAAYR